MPSISIKVAVRRRVGWRVALLVATWACQLGLAKPESAARFIRRWFVEVKVVK